MKKYICIDIGGTSIKYGLADANGAFADKGERPTEALESGGAGIVKKVKEIAASYLSHKPAGVAVSTAGMVDPVKGEIVHAAEHLIPGYTGVCLKREIEDATGLPCAAENDVNCAGLGELWLGAGRGARSLFCLTVGTGIGGCVILDGRVLRGVCDAAGEIGYMHVPGGTFQDLAAASAMVKRVAELKKLAAGSVTGKQAFDWAKRGDAEAARAIDEMTRALARGIANVCYVVNPEVVILGGGVMAQEAFLRPRLERALKESMIERVFRHTRLEFAKLKNDAGMLGALYHFLQADKEK